MSSLKQYTALYDEARTLVWGSATDVLNSRRDAAYRQLQQFDTSADKLEAYKYTDYQALFAPDYGLNLQRLSLQQEGAHPKASCSVAQMDNIVVRLDNDLPIVDSKERERLPQGVFVGSFTEAAAILPDVLRAHYGRLADLECDPATSLNSLFVQEGLLIYVPSDCRVELPIQLIANVHAAQPLMCHQRVMVVLGDRSALTLTYCDEKSTTQPTLATQVAEISVGEDSCLQLFLLEETEPTHVAFHQTYLEQGARSSVELYDVTLQNGHTRHSLHSRFAGPEGRLAAYGAIMASGQQHVDHQLQINHLTDDCRSEMLYKYVLDDESVGAFAGKVWVAQGTHRNQSEQTNANLCAGDKARAYSQPMLEIYADDVECSHGSTVGKLDETALFYMQQRGIPLDEARLLLQHAFIGEVLTHIPLEPLRQRLMLLTDLRLRGRLEKCQSCRVADVCQ